MIILVIIEIAFIETIIFEFENTVFIQHFPLKKPHYNWDLWNFPFLKIDNVKIENVEMEKNVQ